MKCILFLALVLVAGCSAAAVKSNQKVNFALQTYRDVMTKDLTCNLCITFITILDKINIDYILDFVLYSATYICYVTESFFEPICLNFIAHLSFIINGLENQDSPRVICEVISYCESTPKIAQLY